MELVEIKTDADFIVDMMYAKPTNMSGIDAYGQIGLGNRCFIRPEAAESLENLRLKLRAEHLKLKVFDGYRPPQSHTLMMNAMPVKGLYADSAFLSSHCHAAALDVCLCREDGEELDFPTKVDAYLPRFADEVHCGVLDGYRENLKKAAYAYTSGNARENENRQKLCDLMESAGFERFASEWWHFDLPHAKEYPIVQFAVQNGKCVFTPARYDQFDK